jgi:hypothetical protein
MENKPCRLEINTTHIASLDPERWGYEGGTIRCPNHETCKNKLSFEDEINLTLAKTQGGVVESISSDEECNICCFDDENNRTVEIKQDVTEESKNRSDKLYDNLEEYFKKKEARVSVNPSPIFCKYT